MLRILTTSILLLATLGTAGASVTGLVSLDTTTLAGQGTFYVNFQFTSPNGNNAVTLSEFSFGSGLTGILPDSPGAFFSQVMLPFTPGARLTFRFDAETNPLTQKFPDQFSFYLLDADQIALPTVDPLGTDAVMIVTLMNGAPAITTFEGTGPLLQAGPAVQLLDPAAAVPEPASLVISALALVGIIAMRGRAAPISERYR